MPFLVRCPIGIDCILDLIFPAHLSLGRNYAKFPYFYLKPPVGQCADLAIVFCHIFLDLLDTCTIIFLDLLDNKAIFL
jgi:hypothetical protein